MDFLTNPFTTALLFLYQFLGQNIVLSIVVFTVLTRVLTYPLSYQQIKSSKAMQELQPKLKQLQEKHKGDREKLAQEQMRLYREHGVNPLAGCLPLLIQLPILFGLYGAINASLASTPLQILDLQHRLLVPDLARLVPLQNQFLWLNLALPDPTFILPILVVATTWLQSKLMTPTPANADPKDPSAAMSRNMTIMMPLMIGMFSLSFASGLSIYWVVSNIVGIAQYAMLGQLHLENIFPGRKPKQSTGFVPTSKDDRSESGSKKVSSAASNGNTSISAPPGSRKEKLGAARPKQSGPPGPSGPSSKGGKSGKAKKTSRAKYQR
jgi:YidC/Oxa1 family membrane protein insertase